MQKAVFLSLAFIAMTAGLAGCGQTQTVSTAGGSTLTVKSDNNGNGSVNVVGKDGTQVNMLSGSAATYPNLPFPQYPGSSIKMSMNQDNLPGGQPANKIVSLESSDAPDKAVAYYKDYFTKNSWKINMESSQSGMSSISAESGGRIASIMCMPGAPGGKTSIQINVSGQ